MGKLQVLRYGEIMNHEISYTERILKVFRLGAVKDSYFMEGRR